MRLCSTLAQNLVGAECSLFIHKYFASTSVNFFEPVLNNWRTAYTTCIPDSNAILEKRSYCIRKRCWPIQNQSIPRSGIYVLKSLDHFSFFFAFLCFFLQAKTCSKIHFAYVKSPWGQHRLRVFLTHKGVHSGLLLWPSGKIIPVFYSWFSCFILRSHLLIPSGAQNCMRLH